MDDEFDYSWKNVFLGLVFIFVIVALIGTSILTFRKAFTATTTVTFVAETAGNALAREADVTMSGVLVGEVRAVRSNRDGTAAEIELALRSDRVSHIPANATARIVPKTLFGERFVEIVPPDQPVGVLTAGAVLLEHSDGSAVDATRMYDVLYDLLDAVPAQDLAVTLGALNQALAGRGDRIGAMIDHLGPMADGINTELPHLEQQLGDLGVTTEAYTDALPDLIDALDTYRTTNSTLIETRPIVDSMLESLTFAASDTRAFLDENGGRIVRIAADTRDTLGLLARYSPSFGCALGYFADLEPRINEFWGEGTGRAGLHLTIELANPRGAYLPNQDETRLFDARGPICYHPIPPSQGNFPQYPGGAINDGAYPAPSRNPGPQHLPALPDPLADPE
ncbi:MCE family protein [Hoyosella sp. YIM 151337]|uniref:MCE family protein n=1 Tax=Hoyosella sp. YIM 151337 TaxID=2992742 RepID=UPI002235AEA3|nr:MCE family protein [Hoyosella sp. YIM 151337]MCW4355022.1 MCE family protein [Hoyosella sp. YIM 151337]